MPNAICSIPECDEELSPNARLPECKNCRASMGMWRRRGIPAILVRRSKLKKYDCRMETAAEVAKKPKVKRAKPRKK